MKVGISCAGLGPGAAGEFIRRSAQAAERAGFSAFWLPDHVVLFGAYPQSKYPYAAMFGGDEDLPPAPSPRWPLAEPVVGMSWAAAATTKIEIGTSVLILPQRNPVVLAKQLSTLDEFSGGRVALGVGVGWAREEYAAIGVDWTRRGACADEYIEAMRALWRNDSSTYLGRSVSFTDAYMYPKPVRDIPILIGGESAAALRRIARMGDGWFAFNLQVEQAKQRILHLKDLTRAQGRDPAALRLMAPIFETTAMDQMERYREAGVTEFYLGIPGGLPMDDAALDARMAELGHRFVDTVAGW
jgi:probable F420-dependent oxidoreductase